MGQVQRIYVEKKAAYRAPAKALLAEIRGFLGLSHVEGIRILCRYDVEGVSEDVLEEALSGVFAEPPVDDCYRQDFPKEEGDTVFSVAYLPGQFDQRADSAEQCIRFLDADAQPIVSYATTYCLSGPLSEEDLRAIQGLIVNPVDSRIADEEIPDTLAMHFPEPDDVAVFDGFVSMEEDALSSLYTSLSLAMTWEDFRFIRAYFRDEERRDPTVTEIRVLDTYWSDHCRHTTFLTELSDIRFEDGPYHDVMMDTFQEYLSARDALYAGRSDKYISLMDLALLAAKKIKAEGGLADQEESDEINACSIIVPVDVNGEEEEWLLNFKNETHNHPTEIEPFGGAATCLGGAIRDPLSGRTYVYQAMRVTGAGDPTRPQSETMQGKLPQKKLTKDAAKGYSSYGNQIGLATGLVKELYHPGYTAKRMEIGAVLGAAPRRAVIRETSRPGDRIVLLGGRTGRDGIGGATGSSKAHTKQSVDVCGAEVQKGNAPTERKLQRLFRREEVSRLIRKCNDFGAGGVSVAIGELADGLMIDLDAVPKKYAGLDGTEIAISESQERMACVIAPEDVDAFLAYAAEENLEATVVATVQEEGRLQMTWRGKTIVDLSRAFMNTNGAHQSTGVAVESAVKEDSPFADGMVFAPDGWKSADLTDRDTLQNAMRETLQDLNVCSQRGLVEMFDSSIGAGTVVMPYGGQYQLTESQTMVAKIPVPGGKTTSVSMMSFGFDPYLSSWSPFHGAAWAATESVAKIVASGGDFRKIRFTFQEYFRRMSEDPHRWSQPFAALLGAYKAQIGLGLPSIGGKDSMSGSFEQMDVPPTLVSFAVDMAHLKDVITPELKSKGHRLIRVEAPVDEQELPHFEALRSLYEDIHDAMQKGAICAGYVTGRAGAYAALVKMALGNGLGFSIDQHVPKNSLFAPRFGDMIFEVVDGKEAKITFPYETLGFVTDDGAFTIGDVSINCKDALLSWEETLSHVFPIHSANETETAKRDVYTGGKVAICKQRIASPRVFIPIMPGTNCEYDSAAAFEDAGATVNIGVFRNLSGAMAEESIRAFAAQIDEAQIVMFPGGFSAGDEPDGSAKFFATVFRNERIKEAMERLLKERDGLVLGICNGFQTLIKLGLVPYGEIRPQNESSPTLTYNTIGRHISRVVYTKVMSDLSPWLARRAPGEVIASPASHGEGRFVAPEAIIAELFAKGQVATCYSLPDGTVTMDDIGNVNGSYAAIEGITSPDGRVFGKMAHVERRGDGVAVNIYGEQDMQVFASGVQYYA